MTPLEKSVSELREIPFKIRINVLRMLNVDGSGHIGVSFGLDNFSIAERTKNIVKK